MSDQQLKSHRPHIGIFGRRNNGKSSLINALAGQDVSIVSETPGTTTDPVRKAMEITGLGPVIIIDTAGIDDTGDIGSLRVDKTVRVVSEIDLAILVIAGNTFDEYERELIRKFEGHNTPFLIVHSKEDIETVNQEIKTGIEREARTEIIPFSALDMRNIDSVLDAIKKHMPSSAFNNPTVIGDLVSYGDVVLLITPIDVQAPRGRLILPQVQTIRDCLDNDCITVVVKERELDLFWKVTDLKPKLAVTDSQAFLKAAASVPRDIPLTSFSILFARLKGDFQAYLEGTPVISKLQDGDRVLIMESCSHHVAGDDIGRVKIPRWISNFTGRKLEFDIAAGLDSPPRSMSEYRLVIQCGGCMLTRKQVINRLKPAQDAGVPVSNYGMAIAYCLGIFDRAVEPFVRTGTSPMNYL